MFAEIPGVQNQRARLNWSLRNGGPRISVFAFNTVTNKNDSISAPLGVEVFMLFCDQFEKMATANPNTKSKIECYTSIRDAAGNITPEKRLISELWFGVDAEGMVWISIVEGDKPKIKFIFNLWQYNKFIKNDGTELSGPEASSMLAQSTIRALRTIYTNEIGEFTEYVGKTTGNIQQLAPPVSTASKVDEITLEDINF
jgi:hypothetical protein